MSAINKLIEKKRKNNPVFEQEFRKEDHRLKAAVALMKLREENGLSQRELAEKIGKPQSTIARIENGSMNVSVQLLDEIAAGMDKELIIQFK
ncbi:helix-turn-helix transcriptional regulator [Saccharibacillus sp. CPCC 101409]|uniref:helix-turn-helix domain-containing protein n=1 Tax=Saccharibacillus sp. CPCC 101409 TaxID=3058041 RepID=UPI002671E3A7|nr:helix-turn-helix transcriptional regulator [Saccharibacillus sp. CPCC 101409]MDO3408163.1 helix-turn-helix transcriptional regulator [Saccharibacillus sp. CPCC 101409]